ncbi:MAG: prolipoprotein diacylglyceryl transferase family protein [Candidatus Ventricola sp.]
MNKGIKIALLALMLAALVFLVPSPALTAEWTMYGACVALAALLAVLALRQLRVAQAKRRYGQAAIAAIFPVDAIDLALGCIPAAFAGARLSYCLVRFSFYFLEMGPLSVLRTWEGGFLLYGAVLGALLAAALLARRCGAGAAATLDELAVPGLLAVAVCRLGEGLTGEGVGAWVESAALMRFPFAVQNEFGEWQLAVFALEAAAALLMAFAVLRVKAGTGERIATALLLYACCQVVLENMRMDSCLRIGFVRVSQVISAVAILGVTVLRAYRAGGRALAIRRTVLLGVCAALVGGIEWALDKTPVSNVLLYGVMIAACAVMYAGGAWFGGAKRQKEARVD